MEIRKLLIANRGEIAVRILRTCEHLGIASAAVVAPDDANAYHARLAPEVHVVDSYLSGASLVAAAHEAGADAVHPGYGFLAESGDFARAVLGAGLAWVGPPPDVLRAAGDKLEAKRVAAEAGIPVVPAGAPHEVGYPLLVKAAAGGGGRGMRVVRSAEELPEAIEAARREAASAFGDETIFFERYVERPRHVEIQLLADAHGTTVDLGERDCSVQRRYQKVLEESPAPALDEDLRERIASAAVTLARALRYENAGTAEFIVAGDDFFFLELNARIQVEHPVTELVTGVDLVEQQLRVAGRERLAPAGWTPEGYAVEVRLYAEDPRTFLPQAGRAEALTFPASVRVDAGIEAGDEVPLRYDPLIAKLIAHEATRAEALDRLADALARVEVRGVTTNLPFLRWLVRHPVVRAGEATTRFLAENPPLSRPVRLRHPWRGYWRLNRGQDARTPFPQAPPTVEAAATHGRRGERLDHRITAPMPGTVIRVLTAEGDRVDERQPLLVLEAMKMETPLVSPFAGVVRTVHVADGDRVTGGALLVELDSIR